MRPLPNYPGYRRAHFPSAKRWLATGAFLVLAGGGSAALLRAERTGMAWIIALVLLCTGLAWLVRLIVFRVSEHNAQFYHRLVEAEEQRWWAAHRRAFAIEEIVLLGPAGTEIAHWLRLLDREHRPPEEKRLAEGWALRLEPVVGNTTAEREKQLAEMLIIRWHAQRDATVLSSPQRCYWLGSQEAWRAFHHQAAITFPALSLPAQPEKWCGEASLSAIAAEREQHPEESVFLVAGCQSVPATPGSESPAGESAMLWLIGPNGAVQLTRGEAFDVSSETLYDVCQRALKQAEQAQPPEACILFSQPQAGTLAQCGWNVTQHLQDRFWGECREMEALIVLSLAALFAKHHQQTCGWIARDPLHTLALGIVEPYAQGK